MSQYSRNESLRFYPPYVLCLTTLVSVGGDIFPDGRLVLAGTIIGCNIWALRRDATSLATIQTFPAEKVDQKQRQIQSHDGAESGADLQDRKVWRLGERTSTVVNVSRDCQGSISSRGTHALGIMLTIATASKV